MGVSFETYLRRRGDVLMGRRHYVPLRRRHDIPIRRREDVPLTSWRRSTETSLGVSFETYPPPRLVTGWVSLHIIFLKKKKNI